jgi:hypothetical protein
MEQVKENTEKSKKGYFNFALSIFIVGLFVFILLINAFRKELFGIEPGYAPHNFGFNVTFFIPSMMLIGILSLIVIARVIIFWGKWKNMSMKIVSLLMTVPIVILQILQVVWILLI